MPLSLSSENVLWAFETAGVDCAETNVVSLFSESPKHTSRALELKAKSRQLYPVMSENRIEVARLILFLPVPDKANKLIHKSWFKLCA